MLMKVEASSSAWTQYVWHEVRPTMLCGVPLSPPSLPEDSRKQRFHSYPPCVDVTAPRL